MSVTVRPTLEYNKKKKWQHRQHIKIKGRRLSACASHETITEWGAILALNFDSKRGECSATLVYTE